MAIAHLPENATGESIHAEQGQILNLLWKMNGRAVNPYAAGSRYNANSIHNFYGEGLQIYGQ